MEMSLRLTPCKQTSCPETGLDDKLKYVQGMMTKCWGHCRVKVDRKRQGAEWPGVWAPTRVGPGERIF